MFVKVGKDLERSIKNRKKGKEEVEEEGEEEKGRGRRKGRKGGYEGYFNLPCFILCPHYTSPLCPVAPRPIR